MSVYTTISDQAFKTIWATYDLGQLLSFSGIAEGITNTNYHVTSTTGRYVVTVLESLTKAQLRPFLDLQCHLAKQGVLCPQPKLTQQGDLFFSIQGKPGLVADYLPGKTNPHVTQTHCTEVGRALALLHLAGQDFTGNLPNTRDPAWFRATAARLTPVITDAQRQLLTQQLLGLADPIWKTLPHGIIHADLFPDNVLFEGDSLSGLIDFYYACQGPWIYDIAITVNAWCRDGQSALKPTYEQALLTGYQTIRPLTAEEHRAYPTAQRIAALRFWLSRLYDSHFPIAGAMTQTKDPRYFEALLKHDISTTNGK